MKLTFLGAGNIAGAIIGGIVKNSSYEITVFDVNPSQYTKLAALPVRQAVDLNDGVTGADIVFLCVKPQNFAELLTQIGQSGIDLSGKTFVTIAAGISTDAVCRWLGTDVPVIRAMPNTPLLIGQGVTALCRNGAVSDSVFDTVFSMFSACGAAFVLPQSQMNAVIAATSTAPAYVFLLIDSIIKGAQAQGLDSAVMADMVCRMVQGAAALASQSDKTPQELIAMVKSPKGTTEQALLSLEKDGFSEMIDRAMLACTERAEELGQ